MQTDERDLEILWVHLSNRGAETVVGVLYHPPKPIYPTGLLMDAIEKSIEGIQKIHPQAKIILGGDFNGLNVAEVSLRTGLVNVVNVPTRGASTLDHICKKRFLRFLLFL